MVVLTGVRTAEKRGTWYLHDAAELATQLDDFLGLVPGAIDDHNLPVPNARAIIAPHAGYDFSGETAAWAYKALDLSKAKRVFLLGPSHTYYLSGCATTTFKQYATPWGNLNVDGEIVEQLRTEHAIPDMRRSNDVDEHSLEMHLPYLWKRLEQTFGSPDKFPTIVPLLIGDNNRLEEKEVGEFLVPYLRDPDNAFIVSSDFCHWGWRFSYQPYSATGGGGDDVQQLSRFAPQPKGKPIHETIVTLDNQAIDAIKTGSHDEFVGNLKKTKNTVCGRHPIGVMMAALEKLAAEQGSGPEADEDRWRFKFVQYQRSTPVLSSPGDSSVSYASAYAVL